LIAKNRLYALLHPIFKAQSEIATIVRAALSVEITH
jgi:hypothetical protein